MLFLFKVYMFLSFLVCHPSSSCLPHFLDTVG